MDYEKLILDKVRAEIANGKHVLSRALNPANRATPWLIVGKLMVRRPKGIAVQVCLDVGEEVPANFSEELSEAFKESLYALLVETKEEQQEERSRKLRERAREAALKYLKP